jgi:hypothetical protein
MRVPTDTGFFCYRAVEAMMQSMKANEDESDKTAWPKLREALRIDRSVIDFIKGHADCPRHGRPYDLTDAERGTILKVADDIIRRYLEYLKRGKVALPEAEFPMLTDSLS